MIKKMVMRKCLMRMTMMKHRSCLMVRISENTRIMHSTRFGWNNEPLKMRHHIFINENSIDWTRFSYVIYQATKLSGNWRNRLSAITKSSRPMTVWLISHLLKTPILDQNYRFSQFSSRIMQRFVILCIFPTEINASIHGR